MKIICLCQTYYQVIVAIQLKRTLFSNDNMSLILADTSNGAEDVFKNLQTQGMFDEVFYAKNVRENRPEFKSIRNKINRFYQYFFKGNLTGYLNKRSRYDLMIAYNIGWYACILYTELCKRNPALKIAQFEEGLISYYVRFDQYKDLSFFKRIIRIKRFLRQPIFSDHISDFYCFHPELYSGELNPIRIPMIDYNDCVLKDCLREVFLNGKIIYSYPQKYIYFASRLDEETDESPTGEIEVIEQIADIVGKENLLIKLHPRETDIDRYIERGLILDPNSDVPFEVIQLLNDFSGHVFMTTLSGSILNLSVSIDNPPTILFTNKIYNATGTYIKSVSEKYDELISLLHTKSGFDFVYVIKDYDDMKERLTAHG